jgi:hypothetical protein
MVVLPLDGGPTKSKPDEMQPRSLFKSSSAAPSTSRAIRILMDETSLKPVITPLFMTAVPLIPTLCPPRIVM